MNDKFKEVQGVLLSPLFWKLVVTLLGYFFAGVNQAIHPSELITLPDDATSDTVSSIRVGGFALITAVALFAGLMPTGTEQIDKLVDGMARVLGVVAAFGAGWYTLDIATDGTPGPYVYGMVSLAGLAIATLAIGTGNWIIVFWIIRRIAAAGDAVIFALLTTGRFLRRFSTNRLRKPL